MTASIPTLRSGALTLATIPVAPVAILLSCVFSVVVILQNPLLNDDAYRYLRAAEVFNESGGLAVLQSFEWFNYSILIALLDRLLPGGTIAAAHIFNTACYALLTWSFLLFNRELRANARAQRFAALCILCLPLLNEMRYFLIRDIAFCAFAVLSLAGLARFMAQATVLRAFWWCGALLLASAFRLEALLLLALAPFVVLLPDGARELRERCRHFALLAGTAVLLIAVLVVLGSVNGVNYADLITYAYRWYLALLPGLPAELLTGTTAEVPLRDELTLVGGITTLIDNVVNAFSVPLTMLVLAVAVRRRMPALAPPAQRALQFYAILSVATLVAFLALMHFLTQRYAALLCILLLSLVPPILDDLYASALQHGTVKRFRAILAFFCVYYLVDSLLSFGYSQQHIEEGIAWARNELPAGARLQTNSVVIAYHSGRVADYDEVVRGADAVAQAGQSGDYLVLDIDHDDDTAFLDTNALLTKVTSFANDRGDQVRVYLRQ